jgi:hypothetical protein
VTVWKIDAFWQIVSLVNRDSSANRDSLTNRDSLPVSCFCAVCVILTINSLSLPSSAFTDSSSKLQHTLFSVRYEIKLLINLVSSYLIPHLLTLTPYFLPNADDVKQQSEFNKLSFFKYTWISFVFAFTLTIIWCFVESNFGFE